MCICSAVLGPPLKEADLVEGGGSGLLAGPGRMGVEAEPVKAGAAHLSPEVTGAAVLVTPLGTSDVVYKLGTKLNLNFKHTN